MSEKQESCKQCGRCCKAGGPALHTKDLEMVREGKIPLRNLITIKMGELAHNPITGKIAPANVELVKIKGKGKDWDCCYLDATSKNCTIYGHRPEACKVLKCWQPEELLEMVEKDTISRLDILAEDNPIRPLVEEHKNLIRCPDFEEIAALRPNIPEPKRKALQNLVNEDIKLRVFAVQEHQLELSEELFYFGRPLFQLLQQLGAKVRETSEGLELRW